MRYQQALKTGIALTLTLLFLVGCGNASSTPAPEDSIATSTPEIETDGPATDSPRTGDVAPDFTLPDSTGNMVRLADELQENQLVVLVFYHAHTWQPCLNQLGGLEKDRAIYEEKGAKIIALAVQSQDAAAQSVEKTEAQFSILADSEHAVADIYGVYNLFSDSEAAASVFIISQDGRIVWDDIATTQTKRVPSEIILENLPE